MNADPIGIGSPVPDSNTGSHSPSVTSYTANSSVPSSPSWAAASSRLAGGFSRLGGSAGYSFGRFSGALLTFIVLLAMALVGLWRFVLPYTL